MDSVGKDLREPRVQGVGVPHPVTGELGTPRSHMRGTHRTEQHHAEPIFDPLDVRLGLSDGRVSVAAVALQPGVTPLPHREPGMSWCDVGAGEQPGGLLVDPLLGVDLAVEVP